MIELLKCEAHQVEVIKLPQDATGEIVRSSCTCFVIEVVDRLPRAYIKKGKFKRWRDSGSFSKIFYFYSAPNSVV